MARRLNLNHIFENLKKAQFSLFKQKCVHLQNTGHALIWVIDSNWIDTWALYPILI